MEVLGRLLEKRLHLTAIDLRFCVIAYLLVISYPINQYERRPIRRLRNCVSVGRPDALTESEGALASRFPTRVTGDLRDSASLIQ